LTALNFLLVILTFRQNAICRRLEPLLLEHATN
jgi:hypothetical protein